MGQLNYRNHALVGLSVLRIVRKERRIRGLQGISSYFRRPFTEAGITRLRVNAGNVNHCDFYHVRVSSLRMSLTLLAPAWQSPIGLCPPRSLAALRQCLGCQNGCKASPPSEAAGLALRRVGRVQNDSKPYRDNLQRLFLP